VNELTDDELMLMFCDGNAEALALLFDRHRSSVYHFACSMLNAALADGMTPMLIKGLEKAARGITSIEEVYRVIAKRD